MSNSDNIDNQEAVTLEAQLVALCELVAVVLHEESRATDGSQRDAADMAYADLVGGWSSRKVLRLMNDVRAALRTTPAKLDAPDNQEALASEGVEAYVFATCVECTSPAACGSRRFCGVGTHRVALQEEWRCVDCKRVFRCAEEPVRCPIGGCQGRTFAPVARTLPSNEAFAGDDRNGVEDAQGKVARILALAGLGSGHGGHRQEPPNQDWTQEDWEARILEVVPAAVEERCLTTSADILAALSRTPSSPQAGEGRDGLIHRVRRLVRELEAMEPDLLEVLRYSTPARELMAWLNGASGSTMTTRPAGVEEVER